MDLGSDVVSMTKSLASQLKLEIMDYQRQLIGFGNGSAFTLGMSHVVICIDNINFEVNVLIVHDKDQSEPLMIGRSVVDQEGVVVVKANNFLKLYRTDSRDKNVTVDIQFDLKRNESAARDIEIENSFDIPLVPVENTSDKKNVYPVVIVGSVLDSFSHDNSSVADNTRNPIDIDFPLAEINNIELVNICSAKIKIMNL